MDAAKARSARGRNPLKSAAAVRKVARARGKGVGNVCFIFGAKSEREWVVRSDLELANVLDLESDPQVISYEIDPDRVLAHVGEGYASSIPDSFAHMRGKRPELREVKTLDDAKNDPRAKLQQEVQQRVAESMGYSWKLFTDADAMTSRVRLLNWLEVSAALSEARNLPTTELEKRVCDAIQAGTAKSLAELHDTLRLDWRLVFVALFRAHQSGRICVDIGSRKLTWLTSLQGGAA